MYMIIDNINNKMKANNYVLSTEQLTDIGISKTTLTNYVREGLLERCGHGYYTMPDSIEDDMYLLMLRSKYIVFSHETALFLNGLSERTPFYHSVTIPSNASLPASIKQNCNCYYIKPELYELGLIEKANTFGNKVRCYDAERTICDILRSRNRLDEETVLAAIKNYASYKGKDLNKLAKFADAFKVSKLLRRYMEVLL
ncbi:MAG TPA: type IV toxin-antitoxin system AbiEi family antitoxin domain-containing protein [Mogibacterium sp.]|nr:type IV toxin-antitoxin system AbiEi family antitoxin domain-containing protein [Mogibacterium sp.]